LYSDFWSRNSLNIMFVLSCWVASDFLLSAVYCLAKSGVNIFTWVLNNSEICVHQKQTTDTVHYVQNRRLSVVCAVQFPNLKALKDDMELSFILEREDYQRSFVIVTDCALYLLECVCPCVQMCMCISNNDAFIKTAYICSEYCRLSVCMCVQCYRVTLFSYGTAPITVQGSLFSGRD
jgi:hypothetical protein